MQDMHEQASKKKVHTKVSLLRRHSAAKLSRDT